MAKTEISVGDLVALIERGELQLPEMQRRFVWTSTRVRDLLDSLYRGYPSGAILVWESDTPQPTRKMAIQTRETPFAGSKLLLDGQQRLTSLSAVLRGESVTVRNRVRAIDIAFNLDHPEGAPTELQEIEDDQENPAHVNEEDAVADEAEPTEKLDSVLARLNRRVFAVSFKALFTRPNWVRVSDVFMGKSSDWSIIKKLIDSPDDPKYNVYSVRLNRLRAIRQYQYAMHVLPREMSYEEVAEIFVRVNSLGAKLRGSDLALAQITARWPNSLEKFEDYAEECDENGFTIDTGSLVRLIVVFATQQSRFKTVGTLSVSRLEEAWSEAKQGLNFAISFLRANAGIEDISLLSSAFLIIPLAVFGIIRRQQITVGEQRDMLRWLYVANYRGHYSGSSETMLDADLRLLFDGKDFASLLETLNRKFGRLNVLADDFRGRGERSPLFSVAYLAIKYLGATDWHTGLGLSLTHQGNLHYIQYHHVFPKSLLRDAGLPVSEINEIANMAFVSGKTNRSISNKAPTIYMPRIVEARGQEALAKQGITFDKSLWEIGRYRDFLELRRKWLADAVNAFVNHAATAGKAEAYKIPQINAAGNQP